MDSNHSPSASSYTMRQTSLSDLLAGVRGSDGFRFGLPVPLPSTRTYTLDSDDPFGNVPPVDPRPDLRHAATSSAHFPVSPPVPVASAPQGQTDSSSPADKSPHAPPRRSQRLAASSTRSNNTAATHNESTTPPDNRKRKSRSSSSSPRKRVMRKKPPPNAKKDDTEPADDRKPAAVEGSNEESTSCCICMCEPEKEDVSTINGCEHLFCFDCIGKWADRENSCPLCKSRFTSISRVHKIKKRKGEKQVPNSKRVKQRDQRADVISGPAIEAMLASIAAASNGTHSRFGRFLVALGSRRPPTLVASSRRTTLILEDDIFSDETDDDELPMINFNSLMRRAASHNYRPVPPSAMHFDMGFGPMPPHFAMPPPPPHHQQYRSYASNTFEQNAGTSSNPLEIDDSDDDDSAIEVFDTPSSSS